MISLQKIFSPRHSPSFFEKMSGIPMKDSLPLGLLSDWKAKNAIQKFFQSVPQEEEIGSQITSTADTSTVIEVEDYKPQTKVATVDIEDIVTPGSEGKLEVAGNKDNMEDVFVDIFEDFIDEIDAIDVDIPILNAIEKNIDLKIFDNFDPERPEYKKFVLLRKEGDKLVGDYGRGSNFTYLKDVIVEDMMEGISDKERFSEKSFTWPKIHKAGPRFIKHDKKVQYLIPIKHNDNISNEVYEGLTKLKDQGAFAHDPTALDNLENDIRDEEFELYSKAIDSVLGKYDLSDDEKNEFRNIILYT